MECIFNLEDDNTVSLNIDKEKFCYDIESKNIDATDLVMYLSDLNQKLEVKADSILRKKLDDKLLSNEINNLIGYLRAICKSYEEAYNEVYMEDEL